MVFLGISLGRAISGFLAMRYSDQQMIRLGMILTALGLILSLPPAGAKIRKVSAGLQGYVSLSLVIYPRSMHKRALRLRELKTYAISQI